MLLQPIPPYRSIKVRNKNYTWLGGGIAFRIRFILNVYRMKQCVRCGVHIKEETNRLWCKRCMERVMEELEGKADREFRYYFRWNLRHKK